MLDAGTGVAEGSEIVQRIVQDWQRRQQLSGVRYLVEGRNFVPKQFLSGGVPHQDAVIGAATQYFLDFEGNRMRIEMDYGQYMMDEQRFVRRFTVELFDGQQLQLFNPRDRNPEFLSERREEGPWEADIEVVGDTGPAFRRIHIPVLLAHGMVPAEERGGMLGAAGTLRRTLIAEMFDEHGRAVMEDRECVVLRTVTQRARARFTELWVDVARDSAIVRYVRYVDDQQTFQIDMRYADEGAAGYPLVGFVLMEACLVADGSGDLVRTYELHVSEYEPDPAVDEATFRVKKQPGFNVYDWTAGPAGRQYRVGLPGQPDRELREIRAEVETASRSRVHTWTLMLLAAPLLIAIAWLVWLRRSAVGGEQTPIDR